MPYLALLITQNLCLLQVEVRVQGVTSGKHTGSPAAHCGRDVTESSSWDDTHWDSGRDGDGSGSDSGPRPPFKPECTQQLAACVREKECTAIMAGAAGMKNGEAATYAGKQTNRLYRSWYQCIVSDAACAYNSSAQCLTTLAEFPLQQARCERPESGVMDCSLPFCNLKRLKELVNTIMKLECNVDGRNMNKELESMMSGCKTQYKKDECNVEQAAKDIEGACPSIPRDDPPTGREECPVCCAQAYLRAMNEDSCRLHFAALMPRYPGINAFKEKCLIAPDVPRKNQWWADGTDYCTWHPVRGCMDSAYVEYDPQAAEDDGSCEHLIPQPCSGSWAAGSDSSWWDGSQPGCNTLRTMATATQTIIVTVGDGRSRLDVTMSTGRGPAVGKKQLQDSLAVQLGTELGGFEYKQSVIFVVTVPGVLTEWTCAQAVCTARRYRMTEALSLALGVPSSSVSFMAAHVDQDPPAVTLPSSAKGQMEGVSVVKSPKPSCWEADIGYTPDLAGTTSVEVLSADACQKRCADTKDCAFFTWMSDTACHVHDAKAQKATERGAAAGPAKCAEVPSKMDAASHVKLVTGFHKPGSEDAKAKAGAADGKKTGASTEGAEGATAQADGMVAIELNVTDDEDLSKRMDILERYPAKLLKIYNNVTLPAALSGLDSFAPVKKGSMSTRWYTQNISFSLDTDNKDVQGVTNKLQNASTLAKAMGLGDDESLDARTKVIKVIAATKPPTNRPYKPVPSRELPSSVPFISEYVPGWPWTFPAIEIFNPSCNSVELEHLELWIIHPEQGWTQAQKISLSSANGVALKSGGVLVICGAGAQGSSDAAVCGITSQGLEFDGNEAVGLAYDGVLVDAVGDQVTGGCSNPRDGCVGWQVAGENIATKVRLHDDTIDATIPCRFDLQLTLCPLRLDSVSTCN